MRGITSKAPRNWAIQVFAESPLERRGSWCWCHTRPNPQDQPLATMGVVTCWSWMIMVWFEICWHSWRWELSFLSWDSSWLKHSNRNIVSQRYSNIPSRLPASFFFTSDFQLSLSQSFLPLHVGKSFFKIPLFFQPKKSPPPTNALQNIHPIPTCHWRKLKKG